jgi:hypothetical protein
MHCVQDTSDYHKLKQAQPCEQYQMNRLHAQAAHVNQVEHPSRRTCACCLFMVARKPEQVTPQKHASIGCSHTYEVGCVAGIIPHRLYRAAAAVASTPPPTLRCKVELKCCHSRVQQLL